MAWALSHWLVLIRTFQLVATLAAGLLNGFLVAWVQLKQLGLQQNMVVLELMIAIMLVYTTLALLLQHTGGRSKRSGWLTTFIIGDTLFVGVDIGLITVLARAGLPSMCVGLTNPDFDPIDHPDRPGSGYTTTSFSDQSAGRKGELDKFCAFEGSVYFIAIGLILTLVVTIVLSVLRICEGRYTKNTRVSELLDSLERANEKEQQQSPLLHTGPKFMPPPSEGIITRQTSLRSVATIHVGAGRHSSPPAIPRRPVPNRASVGLAISPIDEAAETRNDEEYGALVADGMRHQSQQQHHQHHHRDHYYSSPVPQQPPSEPMLMALGNSDGSALSEADVVADGMQYRPNQLHTSGFQQADTQGIYTSISLAAAPLDEGSAALVSDGSRPMPNLPPYTRRSSCTTAQANGEPRLQDMKPNGYFKQ